MNKLRWAMALNVLRVASCRRSHTSSIWWCSGISMSELSLSSFQRDSHLTVLFKRSGGSAGTTRSAPHSRTHIQPYSTRTSAVIISRHIPPPPSWRVVMENTSHPCQAPRICPRATDCVRSAYQRVVWFEWPLSPPGTLIRKVHGRSEWRPNHQAYPVKGIRPRWSSWIWNLFLRI